MQKNFKVGLFGIELEGDARTVQKKLERPGVEVVNLGLINNPVKKYDLGSFAHFYSATGNA